jgi:hypothetical protein
MATAFGIVCLLMLTASVAPASSTLAVEADPAPTRWPVECMSGVLWKVGGGATPLTYTLAPQIITMRCPPIREWPLLGGTLLYSTRLSLLLEPIITGPETYFIGTAAAGFLEWHAPSRGLSCFFAGGGGFGWLDSRGYEVKGAQGQDFNLNWLLNLGLRVQMRNHWQWSTSLYFQHISNRGMNKVNPGLNALGPMLGLSRRF